MLPMAFDPPKPELSIVNVLPSVFCFIIVGACVLPRKLRDFCGDFIALSVIVIAIWFFFSSYSNPEPEDNPIKFALIYGGISVLYLWNRYGKYFFNKASSKGD